MATTRQSREETIKEDQVIIAVYSEIKQLKSVKLNNLQTYEILAMIFNCSTGKINDVLYKRRKAGQG